MPLKLKEAARLKVVGFAGRALPLFLRSPQEIEKLALIARDSKDKSLLDLFEEIPGQRELRDNKVANELPTLPDDTITDKPAKSQDGKGNDNTTDKPAKSQGGKGKGIKRRTA